MDTLDYDNKIYSHLKEPNTHTSMTHDHTDKYANKIITELKNLKQNGIITPQLYNEFLPRGSFCPKFYGLPKLHKQGISVRPIVACTKAPCFQYWKVVMYSFQTFALFPKNCAYEIR
jgi:hypothetical protein